MNIKLLVLALMIPGVCFARDKEVRTGSRNGEGIAYVGQGPNKNLYKYGQSSGWDKKKPNGPRKLLKK